ncbi:hypothetical protein BC827DRAFT_676384 [Russula dissimulans]|nr:hypothetical protein BC827DRAFT_676384 [Russula dissimulans]
MTTTQPPPSNLKERIAALQQCSAPPSPATHPTSPPPRDASLAPPRGSLRDKIAKFERKGGVPIPRSSFGTAVAPLEEAGSTKSRELYGNRVAALGKGRPTAPGNSGHRAVSSPTVPLPSPVSRTFPDDNAAKSAARLTPNSIGNSVSSSTKSPSRRNSSGFTDTDRPTGPHDVPSGSDEAQEPSGQLATDAQPGTQSGTQDAKASEPEPIAKPTVSAGRRPLSVSSSPSSTGLVVTNITRSNISSSPLRATASEGTPTRTGSLSTPVIHEPSPPSAESHTQEHAPVVTLVSAVQAHISVEQVPVKDTNSLGVRPDRPPQNGSLDISSTHSEPSSYTQLPSSNTNSLKGGSTSTSVTPDASTPNKSNLPPSSTTTSSGIAFPSTTSSTLPRVSGDFDDAISMSPSRAAEPGRQSFSAVVHRGDGDNRPDSRHSSTSKSSTVTPRPSSSSFKTGTDGGFVRSKRNFKHLGAVTVDPPPSPGPGDLGLAALLQDAAWLEERLSGETTALTIQSALGEDGQKAEVSALSYATTSQANAPAPGVVNSTRTKGRGLTIAPTAMISSNISQSPVRLHADASTSLFAVRCAGSGSVCPPKCPLTIPLQSLLRHRLLLTSQCNKLPRDTEMTL